MRIVPDGEARETLAADYAAMLADEVMLGDALSFDQLMQVCVEVEVEVNKAAHAAVTPNPLYLKMYSKVALGEQFRRTPAG